jgi:hypothetical protein
MAAPAPPIPLQRDQHLPFPFNSGLLDVGGVALLLDFPNLILDLFEPGIFPFQRATRARRKAASCRRFWPICSCIMRSISG